MRRVSTMDFYLDFASLLPLAITFNPHPDNDSNVDIRTEVRFADYRAVNGVLVPFRIQRLVNDGLVLDLTVTNATINAGLLATDFSLQ
jgi:hypothetical protein